MTPSFSNEQAAGTPGKGPVASQVIMSGCKPTVSSRPWEYRQISRPASCGSLTAEVSSLVAVMIAAIRPARLPLLAAIAAD
jgi:hypothetical protein